MTTDRIRVARIHAHGGPEALAFEDAPLPIPGHGEVRVRLGAMALNFLDVWVRQGIPGARFPLPIIPGSDGAGVVEAHGPGVHGPDVGTPVFLLPGVSCGTCPRCLAGRDNECPRYQILGETRDGTAAEAIVVPAVNVAPIPSGLDTVHAAAFPLSFMTAWHMLVHKARLQPSERIVIHAAASGVSSAALQIARLVGARIAATAGTQAKRALALTLGAEVAFDARDPGWTKQVRSWAGASGVDVVLDHVGQDTFDGSLRVLAKGGRYVFCGVTSGNDLRTEWRRVFFFNLEVLGSTMGRKSDLLRIAALIGAGRLRPVVDQVFDFARLGDAHRRLQDRQALGKVVVTF